MPLAEIENKVASGLLYINRGYLPHTHLHRIRIHPPRRLLLTSTQVPSDAPTLYPTKTKTAEMSTAKITLYVDVVSPFTHIAFHVLRVRTVPQHSTQRTGRSTDIQIALPRLRPVHPLLRPRLPRRDHQGDGERAAAAGEECVSPRPFIIRFFPQGSKF